MTTHIFLVHGYTDSPRIWEKLIAASTARIPNSMLPEFHAVALEKLSLNASADSDALLDGFRLQVEQAVLQARPVADDRVFVIGHSMGGAVAELLAETGDCRLDGLMLVTPAPLAGFPLPTEVLARFEGGLRKRDRAQSRQARLGMARHLDEHSLEAMLDAEAELDFEMGIQELRAWTGGHVRGTQPSAIECPVLTITTEDLLFQRPTLEGMSKRFRNGSIRHIEGAGHWVHVEQPEALARVLAEFIGPEDARR